MTTIMLSVATSERTGARVWSVLWQGCPITAEITEQPARDIAAREFAKVPRAAKLTLWDGDTRTETTIAEK